MVGEKVNERLDGTKFTNKDRLERVTITAPTQTKTKHIIWLDLGRRNREGGSLEISFTAWGKKTYDDGSDTVWGCWPMNTHTGCDSFDLTIFGSGPGFFLREWEPTPAAARRRRR